MDRYVEWYNEHRPHSALGIHTPDEVHVGIELPEPIPFRAANPIGVTVDVYKQSYRGDPSLPVISISTTRKEAA